MGCGLADLTSATGATPNLNQMSQVGSLILIRSLSSIHTPLHLFLSPDWDEQHGDIKIKESNKPRKSHQQAAEGDYQVGAKHHSNNFYDGGDDENLNGASHEK